MVSKARLDLPDPDSPVMTTSLSRGISTEMFLRLCTRAPCTAMLVRTAVLELIRISLTCRSHIDECQFLYLHVAHFSELDWRRYLADQAPVGEILARIDHSS